MNRGGKSYLSSAAPVLIRLIGLEVLILRILSNTKKGFICIFLGN